MLNRIIHTSLKNRAFVLTCAIALAIYGIVTIHSHNTDIFPDLNAPTVVVMTECGTMSTEDVEALVSYPIETSLSGLTGIRRIRSTASDGLSIVWAEFDWETNVMVARQNVSEKLPEIATKLPVEVEQPRMAPQSSILGEIYILGLRADSTSMMDLRTIADFEIRPRLLTIPGVAEVTVIGGDVMEYQIILDELKMMRFKIRTRDVLDALEDFNRNTNGGLIQHNGAEYSVRLLCASKEENIGKAFICVRGDYSVTLADIAEIKIAPKTPRIGCASIEGKNAILLTITKQPNAPTIDMTDQIDKTVAEMSALFPRDVETHTNIFRSADFINLGIDNVLSTLYEAILFITIILAIFLANIRTTVISLVTLPLSIVATIIIMKHLGLGINTMSLGGIAIAIGSLVDDAIVDVENVWRRLGSENPKSVNFLTVIQEASSEVRIPILNSTLIIIASFIPLFFLSGMEGKMLKPLGIAFVTSLSVSTFVALTLTPALCSYLLKFRVTEEERRPNRFVLWLRNGYEKLLNSSLNHKKPIIIAAVLSLVLCIIGILSLGSNFLPPFNEGSLTINISTVPGTSLDVSNQIGLEAEEILMQVPEVKTVSRKTGRAERDEHVLGSNVSEIEVPFELKNRSKSEMMSEIRERLSVLQGVSIEIGQPISHRIDAMLSGSQAAIAVKIYGDDLPKLEQLATEVKEEMSIVPGLTDVNYEQVTFRPQLRLTPRRELMAEYGITEKTLSEFISVKLSSLTVGMVRDGNNSYDIKLRYSASGMEVGDMLISSSKGVIPLSYICDVKYTSAPSTINRENGSRRIIVSAQPQDRDLESLVNDIKTNISNNITLPEGYWIEYSGQFENQKEATRTLMLTLIISIVIITIILKRQFNNWALCILILSSLPFAFVGGVLSLYVFGEELNIPAIIGFISLFGIAVRGGMLLITEYEKREEDGEDLHTSIIEGSAARLNPILMTALSSALALIPMILAADEPGAEIQGPMAKVILGGLISSTLLSLIIIPILYHSIHKK